MIRIAAVRSMAATAMAIGVALSVHSGAPLLAQTPQLPVVEPEEPRTCEEEWAECPYCHCDSPPTEGPPQCGFWPGDPLCKTVTYQWCTTIEPGGIGGSMCYTEAENWYWS